MSYETEDELKSTVKEIQRRALAGESGAPQDQVERMDLNADDFAIMPSIDRMKERPAERVSKVYLYDKHPSDLHAEVLDAGAVSTLITGMTTEGGTLDPVQLSGALRDELSPTYPQEQGRHESMYKADATGELDLSFLSEGADNV